MRVRQLYLTLRYLLPGLSNYVAGDEPFQNSLLPLINAEAELNQWFSSFEFYERDSCFRCNLMKHLKIKTERGRDDMIEW